MFNLNAILIFMMNLIL